jgi:flagellar hook-length control protein FliK
VETPADGAATAHQHPPALPDANQQAGGQASPAVGSPNRVAQAAAHLATPPQAAASQAAVTQPASGSTASAPPTTPPAAIAPQASASLPTGATRVEAPAQPTQPTAPAPPAAQLAPAFAALSASAVFQPGGTGNQGTSTQGAGPQSLVIRLAPAELGHVQVRVDQAADGSSHVVLAVERTDTLMLLLHDRPQLNQALDAAGISPDGRTLQLSLADPGNSGAPSSLGGGNGGSGSGFGGSPGGGQGGGSPGHDNPRGSQRQPTATAWQRAGVDITA